ncbi:MAG: TIGR01212 family radical SAM protein [Acidobacteriota bacterium]
MKKRYFSFNEHLKKVFNTRVHKIPVDAGFYCPNKDGTFSSKGCIFCDEYGSGPINKKNVSITDQIIQGIEAKKRRFGAEKFIVYFQSHTNTYTSREILAKYIDEALKIKNVVGISIGTRPDCLPDEIFDLLDEISKKTYFWLELGLQSIHLRSLKSLNRNHNFSDFLKSYLEAKKRNIRVCVHVILGIPGEEKEETLETARVLNLLKTDGIKIHPLHVLKNTELEKLYTNNEVKLLGKEEYVSLVCDFIEYLYPETVIQRLTGEREKELFVAPEWLLNKSEILNSIDNELARRNSYQGCRNIGKI